MNNIDTAPKDGTWILLEGEFLGGDTSSWRLGRWDKDAHPDYPWQTLDSDYSYLDDKVPLEFAWSWYAEGRVYGWLPLPNKDDLMEALEF